MPMMHRTGRWVILLLLIAGLISTPCLAFSGEEEINHLYASLPDDQTDALRAAQDENGLDLNRGLHQLVENAYQAVGGILKEGLKTSASLLAVCLLCSLSSLLIGEQNVIGNNAVRCASVGTVLLIGVQRVQSSLSLVSELLEELRVFANALLPAMTAAGVAAGSGSSAFAKQSAAVLGADLMIGLFAKCLLPLTYVTLGIRAAGILSQNGFLNRFSAFIRSTTGLVIRTLLALYLGYLSVCGLVGSAADTLAKKAAKTAVSAGIPIVGGTLTEAAESVFAGGAVIRSMLGVFGLIGVLSCALLPLLSTGLSYLSLRAAAAMAQCVPDHPGREAVDAVADAVSMAFAMCAGAVAMLLISVILCMKSAGG